MYPDHVFNLHYGKNCALNPVIADLNHKFSCFLTEPALKVSVSVGDENTDHWGMARKKIRVHRVLEQTQENCFPVLKTGLWWRKKSRVWGLKHVNKKQVQLQQTTVPCRYGIFVRLIILNLDGLN